MAVDTFTFYEADTGDVHSIRLKPDTAAVAGTPPTGPATNNVKVKVSKSIRQYGIKCRGVNISRVIGTAPNNFRIQTFIPCLTPAAFGVTPFALGATITYKTFTWTVVSLVSEDVN